MNPRAITVVALILVSGVSGCGRSAPSSQMFTLKGVVRKVNASTGEVTISHEEIPGFMSKMTMPFLLKDRSLLDDVQPGDEVEGPLRVTYDGDRVKDVDLQGLRVTSTVPPNPSFFPISSAPETLKPGEVVPDFAVTTQEGKTLRLSDLRGEVVILTFIYTRCPLPEFCPAIDAKFADLARRISTNPARAGRLRLLSVSFDPEHDSPEVLARHAERRGARPPLWTFAVASHDELAKVAGSLGLAYVPGTREVEHNLRTALIGPDGKLGKLEGGSAWSPADLLRTAYELIPANRKD